MAIPTYPDPKDPVDKTDFRQNWTRLLNGGQIESVDEVVITPVTDPPLVELEGQRSFTVTSTTVWLEGGIESTTYRISITVTLVGGQRLNRSANLKTKDL